MIRKKEDMLSLPQSSPRYRITPTLLNSWGRIKFVADDIFYNEEKTDLSYEDFVAQEKEKRYQEFVNLLNRIPTPDNEFMKKGREFEDVVCRGYDTKFSPYVKNGAFQVTLTKDVDIDGVPITLYGVLDVLKRGRIMDIKRVVRYKYPKYRQSFQHPLYLYLVPQAIDFTYLIADNNIESKNPEIVEKGYHLENYTRENCVDIIEVCREFLSWLKAYGLFEIFIEKWQMKERKY